MEYSIEAWHKIYGLAIYIKTGFQILIRQSGQVFK